MKLFNHIQIKVRDLPVSRKFYDQIMEVLGIKVVLEINRPDRMVVGYGTSVNDMFEIAMQPENADLSHNLHIAFNASGREMVDTFYETALAAGAKCNGKPGVRPYGNGFYAAFVIDPDGHNIEAVYPL
jgi:catechol 2,3-dioxygenase-like lactoylglutathione lyase family enzyme